MLALLDLRGDHRDPTPRLPRASAQASEDARAVAGEVLDGVRDCGDEAVLNYARRFDGTDADTLTEVSPAHARAALEALDPRLRAALERAAAQVRWFHEQARPRDWLTSRDGALLGVRHKPLRRVGVYVPGGRAAYPSTVLMTVVPARVAGVDEVVLCTPPGDDGQGNPVILAAAALTGTDRIVLLGGAQAVAAMAYGTQTVPRCDKVVGPGNVYVAEAKALAAHRGVCGVDTHAGVTEVAVVADHTADPRWVAADLVAQAEHDPLAACLLITPSPQLADRVAAALQDEVAATPHAGRVRAAFAGQGGTVLVDDLDHAVEVVNAYAAEHVQIQTADPVAVAERVRAAGAVFVGGHTPVAVGDYCAGPNHTLPTGGTARFTGGLRTDDFCVPVNWVQFDRGALADLAPVVSALGTAEGLPAHVRAVDVRLEDDG